MKNTIIRLGLTVLSLVILINAVSAQPRGRRFPQPTRFQPASAIGVRFGNDFENDNYFAGAHFWLPMGIFWNFVPGFEYFFTDEKYKQWQFNGDFLFKPRPRGPMFFGAGVAAQYLTSDQKEKFGGNVLLGLNFGGPVKPISPYIEARWTFFEKQDYFSLLAGINLMLR
ncbi:MAG: hypothetical protein ACOY90_08430 [Candidatus Zhuqueibacterota bacterium]